jgi:4-hydroxyphenylpyruvate dioxygenase
MKTSIATVSLSGDLEDKLQAIAAAGFYGAEIFENDFLIYPGSAAQVGRIARDLGLVITLYQPFRDFEGLPPPERQRAFDRAERKFDVMQDMGVETMLVCSNCSPVSIGGIDRAADDFAELGERAAQRKILVGFEALAWGRFINDHRDAWEVVRRANHPNIGLILDSFHSLARGIPSDSIRAIPGNKIFIVQLADAPAIQLDVLQWSRHLRNMPGQGDLPVKEFVIAVAATGYDGALSLEIFNDQFRGGSPKTIAADGQRSLLALMDEVKRAQPNIDFSVPELPPRTSVEGVEFIEFSTSDKEASQLAVLFETMGFTRAGQHKSKAVTLYRQGDIRLVVNTESVGLAHSSYVMHGTSAYAIGLKVEDAAKTMSRARKLGAQTFEQRPGKGEVMLPGIRGVGGGLLYFLDDKPKLADVWNEEFDTVETTKPGVGLARIDHVAQTMEYDEMLTWVLFYTSIFDVRKSSPVDIVDPGGLVRSQVIESGSGRLRLTLNGAESHRTFAGHFIAGTFGPSVQHVAFSSNDIFKTARALADRGFSSLQISPNYYEDLRARFGLDDAMIRNLRAFNILYDRVDAGEYFQLYSPVFGEGFFLEIVQRTGTYSGYGAPNAIFRIASQRQLLKLASAVNPAAL